ncbi:hypothetical protein DYB35_002943 [Aphanomyces astaci]|uniref:MIB/HERC2 domain-containing protein n=1 Tax=Aphanomyces astaci TaxID=112090 RepID=A0A3R7E731_APHAT|nr:hypothetical protein DYB35_002943 [Aphanomyces astaci]
MTAALGSSDKGVEELSQNDWLAIQLPKEILSHGGKLAHHFRTLALDAPDVAKRDVLRRFDSLKKESTKEFPATLFEGEDLDRIRIFNSKDTAELKSFQTSTPSAVLRELQLCQTPTSANNHQVTCFQTSYCFQRHLDLLARCVHASSRPDPNANTKYPVSAHDPAIFPEKLFSLASCRLQLEMLSSFRQINPTFYRNGMRILIRTVLECPPQALQHIAPKTAEAAMLQSMFEFCTHVIQDSSSTPPEKLSALSLLLALGESSGLARHLLVVVESLLLNRVGADFPDDTFASEVTDVVARFEAYRVTFDLGSISAKTIKSIRLQEDDDSVCGTIASDGKYLYAFTGQGLSKLGTGYRGTILGNVYATQPLDTFMEWLGWDASKDIPYFVYVVLVQQKLFVWFVRRQVDAKMVPFLFELSVDDLDMVARDCDDAGTVDLIENATNVEFCSDGLHMFVIATSSSSSSSLSWRKLDPADNWACLQHETLDESHVGKEGRDMLTGEMLPYFYTNGHILTGTLKKDKKLKELSIALATSVVQYTEYESALTPHAICFDAPNNLLWSTSAKSVQCHANTGTQVILRPARVLNPALVAAIQPQPSLTSRVVGLRLLSHLESIVDAYLPDDINHMDVTGHAAKIVFAVDVDESTFKSLMEMVSSFADAAGALTEWQEYVVVVCLKMLSLNTLHWLVHKTHAIADVVLKLNFPAVLKSLIATSSNSHIVDAARMLFVLSIDIFHTTISAQWQLLVSYIDKFHHKTLAPEERSVVTLLLDRLASKRKTQDAVQEAATADFDGMHWFEKLVQLSAANMSLQVANDEDKSLVEVGEKLTHLVHSVVHGVLGGVWGHILPVSVLLDMFRIVLNGCIDMCELDGTSTDLLESSMLGQVVASLVGFTQTILVADGQLDNRDQWDVAALTDMTRQVLSLLEKLVPLVASVHSDDQEMSIDVQYVGKSSVDMESAHEYANDTHELKELRLDGATSMTITFDSRCRTELNYDYVTFYHDRSCSAYYGDEKYSGRDSSFNWPGVGSIPPLVIESDSCVVLFHSDGSTVDWGFKFTAVANVSENNVSLHLHWLVAVEEQLTNLLSTVATLGSTWMPLDAALETEQAQFLDNDLLHGGVDDATDDDTEVSAFLRDLIELNTPDSPAAHVAKTLKQHTIQDQGAVAHINRAVRAVAAAMLHHNMSSVDAYALGQGRATNPNPALLKAWKNAQKMRNWFDVGDAKRPTRHPDESSTSSPSSTKPKLTRQPSAYVGASDDSLRTLCANVEERATFLLSLAPASFSLATASDDPTGAKKRWNLLAQYGTALKQGDTNAAAILKKWHLLVDEVEAATELKRKMLYRKQSAGRYQGSHEKTVTELVLEFVQSDVVVSDLAAAVQLRNRRAQFRLLTLMILFRTSEISRNGRLLHTLVERVSTSLSELDANKVHFSTHTHGCSLSLRNNLRGEFAKVLQVFAKVLRHVNSTPPLVGSVLKCIAMDYDIKEDAHLLFQSSIVPAVFNLLLSAHPVVRNAAQATARVLLERFMVKEKESHVQKLLCTRVQHYVDQVHGSVGGAGVFLPQQACFLTSDAASFVSLGLWVYVPRIEWRPLRQGDLVVVGPQWTDGPQAQPTGVVLAVHGNDISVEWHAQGAQKAKKGFHKYDVASTVLEVIPADQDPRGQILLRTNHTDTPWGQLCLRLTTEVKLEASVSLGPSQSTTIIGTDPIPVDTWQYVVLNRENDVLQMTIQGEVAAQVPLCDVLKAHGPTHPRHVVESAHPFHGQAEQWSFFPVSIPNATLVRITFDAQSNLTQASNYIAIYSDTTMEIAYGENMYNQAFGNFPGVGDNTYTRSFVCILEADTYFGFRITVQVVESSTLISNNANNNTAFQVYFGESPSRVSNEKAAACYIEDFKLFDTAPPSGCPKSTPPPPPHFELEVHASELCLHALSLVNVCLVSQNEYGSQVISPSASLHHVLDLAFSPTLPVSVRCCATTVVSRLLSNAQVDVADLDVYIAKAFATIASTVDPWANKPSQLFRPSASDAMWLSTCYAAFLRACCHQIDWGGSISTTLMQKLTDPHAFDQLLAALAVLGGTVDGVFVGSRVSCLVKRDAVEVGTLLKFELVGGQRMARVLFDMDMTKVDSINLDKIMTANKRTPLYLTTLYDRLNPSMHALVDVLHGLNVPASSPTQQQQHLEAQSRLLKAIYLLIHHQPQASVIPLLRPALTELALSQHDGMLLGVKPTQQVFESRHPYRDGQDVYETVFVKNAKSLRISFDAASRTEQGCDYVTFYKDSSHSQRWGDDTYSGRDGSENFPGCGGRPALDIPADSFVLFWHSDSSNNDWGYKFTVEATYKDIPASSFSTDELNQRMYHLSEVMYEQQQHHPSIKSSVTPVDLKGAANNVVEVVKPDQSTRSQDAFRDFNHETPIVEWTVEVPACTVYETQATSSAVLATLSRGDVVTAVEFTDDGWVHLDHGGVSGWCQLTELQSLRQVPSHPYLEFSTRLPGWDAVYTPLPKPDELTTPKRDDTDSFESHFNAETIAFTSADASPLILLAEFSQSATVQYAKECLRSYVSCGLHADDLSVATFGQLAQLFALEKSPIADTLGDRLKSLASQPEFASEIVSLHLSAAAAVTQSLPRRQTFAKVVQDMNRDSIETIYFPGASSIRIEFDKDTHCHETDEFVRVYDKQGIVGSKYQGPKGGGWPGVGTAEPLVVDSDTAIVQFEYVSDTGATRLIRFTAYGEYRRDRAPSPPLLPPDFLDVIQLSLWVFCLVAPSPAIPSTSLAAIVDMSLQLYQVMPERIQAHVIALWAALLTNPSVFNALTACQIKAWVTFVKNKLRLQHESDLRRQSILLQRLVQTVVDMDMHLNEYLLHIEALSDTFTNFEFESGSTLRTNITAGPVLLRTTQGVSSGRHAWDIHIQNMTRRVDMGIVAHASDAFLIAFPQDVPLNQGDVVGFELDLHLNVVTFKRNEAVVGSQPVGGVTSSLYPAVVLHDLVCDRVHITKQPPLRAQLWPSIAQNPPWYNKLVSSVRLLRGLNAADSPSTIHISSPDSEGSIPGAEKLHVHVRPSSVLAPDTYLALTNPKTNSCSVLVESANHLLAPSPHLETQIAPTDMVLTLVSRGSDWQYGNDDGAPGNVGVVLSVESWQGVAKSAVRVQWLHNDTSAIYRYGYHGLYDVQAIPAVEAMNSNALVVDGDAVQIHTKPKPQTFFKGSLHFDGTQQVDIPHLPSLDRDFTIQLWVKLDKVEASSIFHIASEDHAWWMGFSLTSSHQLTFTICDKSEEAMSVTTSTDFERGGWHRVDVCACGSMIAVHLDSKLLGHQRLASKLTLESSASRLTLGANPSTSVQKLHGHMFGLRIWNAPLHLRDYSEFFINDERHLIDECPTFDQLAIQSSVQEQWYFECSCGDKGSNYDDGKRMVQCDVCVFVPPRYIHADVVDVDDVSYSPAYIVLIRPNVGPFAHSLGTLPSHTVAKTYSEWRRLYQTLLRVSDGQHRAACTCVQGSCPFWTMHPIVQCIPFPKKDFFRRRHSPVLLQTRKRALSYFVTTVLSKLQIFRPDLFDSSRTYSTASSARPPSSNCTFLRALETFLGLDDDTIRRQFVNVTHKSRLKLTLQGWHLDRQSLCSVTTA